MQTIIESATASSIVNAEAHDGCQVNWTAVLKSTITLFAIVNLVGSISFFLGAFKILSLFVAAIGMKLLMQGLSHYFK